MKNRSVFGIKDMIYILIFLVFIIVFLLTFKLADNVTAIDYIGFSGTLISIILAVVALIYAFFQSLSFGTTNSKLEESANKIEVVTNELRKFSSIEQTTNKIMIDIQEVNRSINQAVQGIQEVSYTVGSNLEGFQRLSHTIDANINNLHNNVDETRLEIVSRLSTPNTLVRTTMVDKEDAIEHFLEVIHNSTLLYFKYLSIVYEKSVITSLEKYIEWSLETDRGLWSKIWSNTKNDEEERNTIHEIIIQRNIGLLSGYHQALSINGWLKLKGKIYSFTVMEFDDILLRLVNERIVQLKLNDVIEEIKEVVSRNQIEPMENED